MNLRISQMIGREALIDAWRNDAKNPIEQEKTNYNAGVDQLYLFSRQTQN